MITKIYAREEARYAETNFIEILETTDYMSKTIDVWERLNFSFDAVSIGFVVSETQAALIANY